MLYIDPDECIDCGACVPECPTKAIMPARRVPSKWNSYIQLNATRSKETPLITEHRPPPEQHGG